ncbi:MAG: hypothetical protein COW32_04715 [Candidatus Aquicultor secundus]|uniref:Copper transporter n=1 Tax=Candidatus Aquicultor secundus TaxID=1973895 RepID=A0A2M7T625_9ACTN|nr:copper transporter [Candidatus Aquicultor secundus]NCO66071.1 copper transporter [Solirubrobacter sp.]OIO87692.1 MAG: hypothetical protein AUK32_03100 [Candidatus Aquicultor secundus]PIU27885.1 MAG: hypothetical protein COT10_01005 [Candidatus Aquicultor secundus]PIW22394.1 MAG: hypothetical protein COW32_04715 [Candidatus Aquicultor secundus]PIX53036.1 MAG: hypothetical protein COZ51_01065 [Candidatus Aquicultor secundus]
MLDMRYHIASLVAVFFALAIGILLGTVIVDKGVLVNQQQALVKRIETNFNELREENRMLRDEVGEQRKFATQVIPLAIEGRLDKQNVGVIVTADAGDEIVSGLIDGFKKAGATASSIRLNNDIKLADQALTQLKPYFTADQLTADNARELVLKRMVDELAKPSTSTATAITTTTTVAKVPFLVQLSNMGFIKTDINFSLFKPINAAVIVGGSDSNQDPLKTDLPLAAQLKAIKIRAVGVETSVAKKSYIKTFQEAGIPTVDNINQPTGIISTVFALAGQDGDFGIKGTAGQFMPTYISP